MKAQQMRTTLAGAALAIVAATLPVTAAHRAEAQNQNPVLRNVVPDSAMITMNARIRSINPETREVALVTRSGAVETITAGPAVRLEMLKPGDTVNAQYYREVAFELYGPGHPAPETEISEALARKTVGPGGVGMRTSRISGLVVGIDLAAHRIDVVNPTGGGVYTVDVTDPNRQAALPELKVGDTISAVVNEALAISIQPAP